MRQSSAIVYQQQQWGWWCRGRSRVLCQRWNPRPTSETSATTGDQAGTWRALALSYSTPTIAEKWMGTNLNSFYHRVRKADKSHRFSNWDALPELQCWVVQTFAASTVFSDSSNITAPSNWSTTGTYTQNSYSPRLSLVRNCIVLAIFTIPVYLNPRNI
jgi:hypothetical protein